VADESLILAAQVVDQFSAPIRDMQRQLRSLTDANKKSHIEGTSLAKTHGTEFGKLRESVSKTSEVFRREFAPVFKGVAEEATGLRFSLTGIGGAAAAAVGGASAMAFSFAGTARPNGSHRQVSVRKECANSGRWRRTSSGRSRDRPFRKLRPACKPLLSVEPSVISVLLWLINESPPLEA
jgi:hypothetical protein